MSTHPRMIKVWVREYKNVSYTDMHKLIKASRQRKYGFKDAAYEVVEVSSGRYDVRLEFTA